MVNKNHVNRRHMNKKYLELAQKHLDNLTKPRGSLGRLEQYATRLAGIYETQTITIPKKVVFVFAADHGVASEGVSAFPAAVTPQMVFNFLAGGAGINVLARHAEVEVVVVDVGVNYDFKGLEGLIHSKVVHGTRNMAKEPAMSREQALQCMEVGRELVVRYADMGFGMFATGEMGIANTTASAAITSVITSRPVATVTGRGTGIDDAAHKRKIDVIERAIATNKPDRSDPIDVLAKVGGAEIAAIAGMVLGAAQRSLPVVVDGFISSAGALIAYCMDNTVKDYMFFAHMSQEVGHKAILEFMDSTAMLDLGLRLGEGTGAALAMTILDAAIKIYSEMATFQQAGVSDSEES
ncbi:MAG: nicotinate-nucleotide--dimethylbenzimidazole phosphoribosyltransferase [Magnetococcales bacterium]|uniref:Nicotinate-nucleotide--dimethylbenzimidazole phosphoribosyltransferase n=2 Tax=Candidatus Magnetobacterium casense TaxID=1455061 RepID=A0ABS6S046_9BACT|nr:nicotinate-nucleotide--dimethylbenzimidazole phosphoribosyltransferase [Nitrospirota bacterium]MBV6342224.1 nicotinate-nucleotide--dimethylbenzimidazole phosphoribosyltransferase [Candidatus Magnetobacterium casensis]